MLADMKWEASTNPVNLYCRSQDQRDLLQRCVAGMKASAHVARWLSTLPLGEMLLPHSCCFVPCGGCTLCIVLLVSLCHSVDSIQGYRGTYFFDKVGGIHWACSFQPLSFLLDAHRKHVFSCVPPCHKFCQIGNPTVFQSFLWLGDKACLILGFTA